MSEYQLFLDDEQKKIIINYIDNRRFTYMLCMYWLIGVLLLMILKILPLVILNCFSLKNNLEGIIYIILVVFMFLFMFLGGFGKYFGVNCDISCIKKDNYSLNHAKFVRRKENSTNRHPYYIYDDLNNLYICPVFLHYRNADSEDNFLYITLGNGRRYALLDN